MAHQIVTMLSYPRAASVFLLNCLQYGLKTENTNWGKGIKDIKDKLTPINFKNNTYIYKAHQPARSVDRICFDQSGAYAAYIVLILRDPKEVLTRGGEGFEAPHIASYCGLLNYWARSPNKKTLVYYDDIIKDPCGVIEALVKEINPASVPDIKTLKLNIENIRQETLKIHPPSAKKKESTTAQRGHLEKYAKMYTTDNFKYLERYFK